MALPAYNISEDDVARFIRIIKQKYNLDFSGYNRAFLRRRIFSRMNRTRIFSVEEYCKYLENSPDELSLLLQNLTINVSEFMRNPEVFDIIQTRVIPVLAAQVSSRPIKVWTAGCSRGEEPYSVAIVFHKLGMGNPERVRIVATDIDKVALEKARIGEYQPQSLKNLSRNDVKIFFEKIAYNGYRIKPAVKKLVVFRQHDIVSGRTIDIFDMIICRNVGIYFSREYRYRMYYRLIKDLAHGGFLIIGKSEMLPNEFYSIMEPYHLENRIYRKVSNE